jgi:hypothetical protein
MTDLSRFFASSASLAFMALALQPTLACTGPVKSGTAGATGTGGSTGVGGGTGGTIGTGGSTGIGGTGGIAGTSGSGGTGGTGGGTGGTGAGGGAGTNPDQDAGTEGGGSGGGGVLERVFSADYGYPFLVPCDANGACPAGEQCFRLAAELAICDKAERPVQTNCANSGVDECGCNGAGCGAGQTCASVAYTAHFENDCLDTPCASPGECTNGTVCTPTSLILGRQPTAMPVVGRCFTPACRSDADCTGGVEGRCALLKTRQLAVAGTTYLDKVGCVFAGLWSAATACPPDQATGLRERNPTAGNSYYTCAGR